MQVKTNIEESIASEIDLLCEWSANDRRYVINELLRFALTQDEAFQKYKAEKQTDTLTKNVGPKPALTQTRASSDLATNPAATSADTKGTGR